MKSVREKHGDTSSSERQALSFERQAPLSLDDLPPPASIDADRFARRAGEIIARAAAKLRGRIGGKRN